MSSLVSCVHCEIVLSIFCHLLMVDIADCTGEVIQLSDVKDFGVKFWLLAFITVAYNLAVIPFISIAL